MNDIFALVGVGFDRLEFHFFFCEKFWNFVRGANPRALFLTKNSEEDKHIYTCIRLDFLGSITAYFCRKFGDSKSSFFSKIRKKNKHIFTSEWPDFGRLDFQFFLRDRERPTPPPYKGKYLHFVIKNKIKKTDLAILNLDFKSLQSIWKTTIFLTSFYTPKTLQNLDPKINKKCYYRNVRNLQMLTTK